MSGAEDGRAADSGRASQAARAAEARASLAEARRIVVKIGTNTIIRPGDPKASAEGRAPGEPGGIDDEYLAAAAAQVAELVRSGRQVIVVTSGAIGVGALELGLSRRVTEVRMRQACAAVGQIPLMDAYKKAFSAFGLKPAQILVTRETWDDRAAYLNLRASVEALLDAGVVPVFNENDVVSTAEIGNAFGDNDQLSALIASKADAELLIILSDVDALYDANPKDDPGAKPIGYVAEITADIAAAAGGRGSEFSTGGMATKLKAVAIARDAGCKVVIADGRAQRIVSRIASGEELGTLFDAHAGLSARERWIKNSSPRGSIRIDSGALAAIRARHSLLPAGAVAVEGRFDRGDVVLVNDAAKVITAMSSEELGRTLGKKSEEIESILGPGASKLIARPEETVFLDE